MRRSRREVLAQARLDTEQNTIFGVRARAGLVAACWVAVSLFALVVVTGLLRAGGVPAHGAMFGGSLLGIGGVAFAIARAEGYPVAWRRLQPADWLAGLVIGTGLAFVGSGLVMLAIQFSPATWAPRVAAREAAYAALLRPDDWRYLPVVVLVVSLTPAFTEELFYRNVVATRLDVAGSRFAIVFGALLFAVVHLDVFSLLPLVVVGVVLGVLRRARDWVACVLPHAVLNLWGGAITPRLPESWLEGPAIAVGAVVTGGVMLSLAVPWRQGWGRGAPADLAVKPSAPAEQLDE